MRFVCLHVCMWCAHTSNNSFQRMMNLEEHVHNDYLSSLIFILRWKHLCYRFAPSTVKDEFKFNCTEFCNRPKFACQKQSNLFSPYLQTLYASLKCIRNRIEGNTNGKHHVYEMKYIKPPLHNPTNVQK